MSGRKRQTRLRPLRLAEYIAWSAAPKSRLRVPGIGQVGHADRHRHPGQPGLVEARDGHAHALGHGEGGGPVGLGEDQRELLAPHPGERVLGAHLGADRARDGLQHPVPDRVPVRVVDVLEVVNVAHEQGEGPLVPRGPHRLDGEPVVELALVQDAREPVDARRASPAPRAAARPRGRARPSRRSAPAAPPRPRLSAALARGRGQDRPPPAPVHVHRRRDATGVAPLHQELWPSGSARRQRPVVNARRPAGSGDDRDRPVARRAGSACPSTDPRSPTAPTTTDASRSKRSTSPTSAWRMLATSRATRVKTSSGRAPRATSRATLTSAAWASTTRSSVASPPSSARPRGGTHDGDPPRQPAVPRRHERRPCSAWASGRPTCPRCRCRTRPRPSRRCPSRAGDHHPCGGPAPRISSRERPVELDEARVDLQHAARPVQHGRGPRHQLEEDPRLHLSGRRLRCRPDAPHADPASRRRPPASPMPRT